MEIFDHRYYRVGKMLMMLTGQWPYQSILTRYGILVLAIMFVAYQIVAQILAVVKYGDDWKILLQCFVPNVFVAVCISKYLSFTCNSQKTLKLLDHIRMDWQVWARHQEVKILHEYAKRGGTITVVYTAAIYCSLFVFMIQPLITKIIFELKNNTEPGKFLFPVIYYHLDVEKYYCYLIMYVTVCTLIIITPFTSSEIMLIIYVQHVCGIFSAVGHKLERIKSNDTLTRTEKFSHSLVKDNSLYLSSCIDRHNEAIEYANLIKTSYTWNIFYTIVFGMILINATGLTMLLRTNEIVECFTYVILSLAIIMCFYVECGVSQILIDHSISVPFYIAGETLMLACRLWRCVQRAIISKNRTRRNCACAGKFQQSRLQCGTYATLSRNNSQWYRLPPKTQKILQLITIRCTLPCHLTAGNMLIMSLKNFGRSMQTTVSYFAFMRSTQGI